MGTRQLWNDGMPDHMPDHMLPFAFGLVLALVPQCAVALNRRLSLRSPTSVHRMQESDARRTHSR
eukprot:5573834-Pleurochrysis_carterae.AAC.1